jgi:predicted membrane-bound spermidine synthase
MLVLNNRSVYLFLIFVTGAVVLSMELITSRILAPFFGVSLYIWTAILSTTLTFLAVGYQVGGCLTTKVKEEYQEMLLLSIPLLSVFFILLSCLLYPVIFPLLSGTGLILGSFVGSFILLAFPLVLLSSLNPILIALFRKSPHANDSGAGFVFFISTLGSVGGVLTTTLLIVPNITNYSAMLVNGIILGIFTLITHFITKNNRESRQNVMIGMAGVTAIILCGSLLLCKDLYLSNVTSSTNKKGERFEILSEYPSHYGNLKVVGIFSGEKKDPLQYILFQNGVVQNKIGKRGESLSAFTYNLEQLAGFAKHAKRALVLGFGAGVVPRTLRKNGMQVSVVDINPLTLRAAKKYFHYKDNGTKFFFEDARVYVKNCDQKYDLVVLDLFHGDGMPEHITSQEFFQDINECLNSKGVLLANMFIAVGDERGKMSLLATISSVFGDIHFFHTKTKFELNDKIKLTNANIVATKSKPPERMVFDLSGVPKSIQGKVFNTLKTHKKFKSDSFFEHEIVTDKGNIYTSLFVEPIMLFRKNLVSQIPSRILMN